MAGKSGKVEKKGISIWRIIGAVVSLVVLITYAMIHVNFVTGRSLLLAFPGWDVTYKGCWPKPFGGAWVSDVTLVPIEDNDEEVYHFDSLNLDVPMFQYYRSGFSRKRGALLTAIKDIRMTFSGGHGQMTIPFTSEMFVFGNASAAPFEADGCTSDGAWINDEFSDMGLTAEPTELSMAWHRSDDRLVREQSIHTPGVGRVDYRGEELVHDDLPLFSLMDSGLSELTASEWHVRDEGFAKARNDYCAKKDGITPSQFVDRHLLTLQRMLAAIGLEPSDSTRLAYRRYVENGAPLDLTLTYAPTISGERYYDIDIGRWIPHMHGGFNVDGRAIGVGMKAITPRPMPENDDIETTWGLVQYENSLIESRRAAAAEQPEEFLSTARSAAPTIAVATSATPASSEDVLYAMETLAEDVEDRPKTIVDYSKLADEVGQRFMFHLKGKPAMRVEVVGIDEGVIKVRRYLRSGWLEQGIARTAFESAERVR
jgi:hypothetical protein